MSDTCGCGHEIDPLDLHVRFALPDPVLELPGRDQTQGSWMSGATASDSVMMQVPAAGPFVRVLLPVALQCGARVTFGAWLGVHPDNLQRAFAVWWTPKYRDLVLSGYLGNWVPPWRLLGKPVTAVVRSLEHTPYCAQSDDAEMQAVIEDEWPHGYVFDALPAH